MNGLGATLVAWSAQILGVALAAEVLAPLLARCRPRDRARFWTLALGLAVAGPWLFEAVGPDVAPGLDAMALVVVAGVARAAQGVDLPLASGLITAWAAVAIVRTLRLGRGLARLAAVARTARPAPFATAEGSPSVRETEFVEVPAAWSFGRTILVPPGFAAVDAVWRRAALVHEEIHLERFHGLALVAEELFLAVFWFHPAAHRLVARVRDAREELVDELTLAKGVDSASYADMLVAFASRLPLPAPAVSGTTALRSRLRSLIDLETNPMTLASRRRSIRRASLAATALLAAASLAASAAPVGGESAQKDAPAAKAPARKVVSKVNPEYPPELRKDRVEGTVTLRIAVDREGTVTNATARPEDRAEFAKAALAAVRQWRFEPGDKPVEMTFTIRFKLS